MNRTLTSSITALCSAAALALFAGCGSAPASPSSAVVVAPPGAMQSATYGTVTAITQVDRQASGAGAALGAVVGGVLGHQVGGGTGRDVATVAGAVAGGYAGHKVEENRSAAAQGYRVEVRYDDGRSEAYQFGDLNGLRVGERVRWDNGQLQRM